MKSNAENDLHLSRKRLTLVCVAGLTPQVVTENLYALIVQERLHVDEIRIITTASGRKSVLKQLLDPEDGKFFAFCRDYGVDPTSIRFDESSIAVLTDDQSGEQLDDIRTEADNQSAATQIAAIVREVTARPDTLVHASVGGGRKTMGVYLASAMQLFGHAGDRVSHILVSEDFENHKQFYYVPPDGHHVDLEVIDRATQRKRIVSTASAEIALADVPFLRMRHLMSDWLARAPKSFAEIVTLAQEDLSVVESLHRVELSLAAGTVFAAGRKVKLTNTMFFWYALFAVFRDEAFGDDGCIDLDAITTEDVDNLVRRITKARGLERSAVEAGILPEFNFIDNLLSMIGSPKKDLALYARPLFSKINQRLSDAGPFERLHIKSQGTHFAMRYGLDVSPGAIQWT